MDAMRIITTINGDTLRIPEISRFSGQKVELIIFPLDDDHADMNAASLAGLSLAYGNEEPNYSACDLREKNLGYAER